MKALKSHLLKAGLHSCFNSHIYMILRWRNGAGISIAVSAIRIVGMIEVEGQFFRKRRMQTHISSYGIATVT